MVPCKYGTVCQLHRFAGAGDTKYGVGECSECKVALCICCFKTFHTKKDLVKDKAALKELVLSTEDQFQCTRRNLGKPIGPRLQLVKEIRELKKKIN